MVWIKSIFISIIVLGLFAGGILFDIFVIKRFSGDIVQEQELRIKEKIYVSTNFKPTHFIAENFINTSRHLDSMTNVSDNDKEKLKNLFNKISDLTKKTNGLCKGYLDSEKYSFYNAPLSMIMQCNINKEKEKQYRDFIVSIIEISKDSLMIKQSIRPYVTPEQEQKIDSELIDKVLESATKRGEQLSKNIGKTCHISDIIGLGDGFINDKLFKIKEFYHEAPNLIDEQERNAGANVRVDFICR